MHDILSMKHRWAAPLSYALAVAELSFRNSHPRWFHMAFSLMSMPRLAQLQ
jgi:hypothetical protein